MKAAWCVSWQSAPMPAPAFWYFRHQVTAQDAYVGLQRHGSQVDPPRACQVPDDTPFYEDGVLRRTP